ncbi:MAG: O-antigen ligase family protein [Ilumatobacteraceae bacterium]
MTRRASRPLGALLSQGIVAGSSLVLQVIALRQLGVAGLGSFSLLLGILITVNSIQSGWLGDSLTVLDRFEPGYRRALFQSQIVIVALVAIVTTTLAIPIGGVDGTTALLFGLASVAWVLEETVRRLLIARREFWKLVANDAAFACGSFGLIGYVVVTGGDFALDTLVLALLAGAIVAIGVGVVQLPRVELSPGITARSRMRELSSFAVWRAAQVGLRPGSQAIVRAIVAAAISLEALGQLEAARLLLAPVLTAVTGAGVYLLPTYAAQARAARRLSPNVEFAMFLVGALAAGYGLAAIALRTPLAQLLTNVSETVSVHALIAWTLFAVGFGVGVPAGNAIVARGRSRRAFMIRVVDATIGIAAAATFAALGWADAVPAGLALGAFVGAALLLRALRALPSPDAGFPAPRAEALISDDAPILDTDLAPVLAATLHWEPSPTGSERARPTARAVRRPTAPVAATTPSMRAGRDRLLWIIPLVLIVATEYKFRRRSIDDALAGSIDPTIALELGVYALIGAWVVWRLAPNRPRLVPLLVIMWGYVLTTAASALYSVFPMLGLARAVQLVIIAAVIHLVAVEGTLRTVRVLVHGWVALISVSIVAGLLYASPATLDQASRRGIGRFTWLDVHPVSAGSMLAVSILMLFGLWLSAARMRLPWPRWVYGALFLVQFAALIATRTRGSIAGACIAIGLMAWLWSGQRMKPQLALASLVAFGGVMFAFGDQIVNFAMRGETTAQLGTFNRRTEIWSLAWESFLARPLHGLGFTSAKGVFFDETQLGGAHNAAINVMIDVGLLGIFWWLLLLGATIVAVRRLRPTDPRIDAAPGATGTRKSDRLVIIGVLTASLINSVTTEGLGAGVNVSLIWWLAMIAWVLILERTAPTTEELDEAEEIRAIRTVGSSSDTKSSIS